MPTIFLIFLAVPLVEIFLLIKVGNVIGAPWTIALVVLTALVGAWLVRLQGLSALNRVRQSAARGELPALELLEGLFLLAAGALLLTPGFFYGYRGVCVLDAATPTVANPVGCPAVWSDPSGIDLREFQPR